MIEWVVNASPIIVLSRLGLLEQIEALIPRFLIPSGVVAEINAGPAGNPAAAWLADVDSGHVVDVTGISPTIAGWDLGKGESEVLSWSYEHEGCGAILDDFAARKCAKSLGIPFRGTLGLLILAKRRGVVAEIGSIVDDLPRVGFRISSALVTETKRLAGE